MSDSIEEGVIVDPPAQPLALVEAPPPPQSLFGSDDPMEILKAATGVANALLAVATNQGFVIDIKGKKYPKVEAWQTMGAMLSMYTVCDWTRKLPDGWEARVSVFNRHGVLIGSAEASCLKTEHLRKSWDDFALRSMAQTRATGKAYRSNLAFIMVLAGYEATPAEEMPPQDAPPPVRAADKAKDERKQRLDTLIRKAQELGLLASFDMPVVDGPTFRDWARIVIPVCEDWQPKTWPTGQQLLAMEQTMQRMAIAAAEKAAEQELPF